MQIMFLVITGTLLAQSPDALGQLEFRAGRYRAAKKLFQESAQRHQGQPEARAAALANLAQAQLALGEQSQAAGSVRQALDLMPRSGRLWNLLGQVLFAGRQFDEAGVAQRKALDLTLDTEPQAAATVLNDLALLHEQSRQGEQAIECLRRAQNLLSPGHARARVLANLGLLAWKFGPKSAAADYLEQALKEMEQAVGIHHPDVGRILEDYSAVLAKSGRKQTARQMAERARQIRSNSLVQTNTSGTTVDWRDLGRQ